MALTITEHPHDPDDPDAPLRRLWGGASRAGRTAAETEPPWVVPDYSTVAREAEIDSTGQHPAWPGPPLIMPAGLLPDGRPPGPDELENARRITGVRPDTDAEADAVVFGYWRQQNRLRQTAGIPRGFRDAAGHHDPPAALAAIVALHKAELERRRAAG